MDNDVDSVLLQQFSSMATQDRDVLIAEFRRLLGNHLNESSSAFYLEMSNWNLQDAICSYFEYHSDVPTPVVRLPCMRVVPEANGCCGEDQPPTVVGPNCTVSKVWHIMNTGEEAWPVGCYLCCIAGYNMSAPSQVLVDSLAPGCSTHIRLELISPNTAGIYKAQFQMFTSSGKCFGERLWVVVQVIDSMMTGISDPDQMIACESSLPASGDFNLLPQPASPVSPGSYEAAMSRSSPPSFSAGSDLDNMDMS